MMGGLNYYFQSDTALCAEASLLAGHSPDAVLPERKTITQTMIVPIALPL